MDGAEAVQTNRGLPGSFASAGHGSAGATSVEGKENWAVRASDPRGSGRCDSGQLLSCSKWPRQSLNHRWCRRLARCSLEGYLAQMNA